MSGCSFVVPPEQEGSLVQCRAQGRDTLITLLPAAASSKQLSPRATHPGEPPGRVGVGPFPLPPSKWGATLGESRWIPKPLLPLDALRCPSRTLFEKNSLQHSPLSVP